MAVTRPERLVALADVAAVTGRRPADLLALARKAPGSGLRFEQNIAEGRAAVLDFLRPDFVREYCGDGVLDQARAGPRDIAMGAFVPLSDADAAEEAEGRAAALRRDRFTDRRPTGERDEQGRPKYAVAEPEYNAPRRRLGRLGEYEAEMVAKWGPGGVSGRGL